MRCRFDNNLCLVLLLGQDLLHRRILQLVCRLLRYLNHVWALALGTLDCKEQQFSNLIHDPHSSLSFQLTSLGRLLILSVHTELGCAIRAPVNQVIELIPVPFLQDIPQIFRQFLKSETVNETAQYFFLSSTHQTVLLLRKQIMPLSLIRAHRIEVNR